MKEWRKIREFEVQKSQVIVGDKNAGTMKNMTRAPDPLTKYIEHDAREKYKQQHISGASASGAEYDDIDTIVDNGSARGLAMLSRYKSSRDMVSGSSPIQAKHARAKLKRGNTASRVRRTSPGSVSTSAGLTSSLRVGTRGIGRGATPASIGMRAVGGTHNRPPPGLVLALGASAHDFTNYASRLAGHGILGKSLMGRPRSEGGKLGRMSGGGAAESPKKVAVMVPFLDTRGGNGVITMGESDYGGLEVEFGGGAPPSPLGAADGFADDFGGWDDAAYSGGGGDSFQIIRMSGAMKNKNNKGSSSKESGGGVGGGRRGGNDDIRSRGGHGRLKSSGGKRRRRRGRRRPKSAHPGGRRSRSNSRDF